jgi:hypothetical protein
MQHLMIAGIPGSGKSTFGSWLETNESFYHIDAELPSPSALDDLSLRLAWDQLVGGDSSAFQNALVQLDRPIVFDWGFPMTYLSIGRTLKSIGLECWWFDADIEQARRAYAQRGRGTIEDFDRQIAAIRHFEPKLRELFQAHRITTLDSNGVRGAPQAIWASMLQKTPSKHGS